MHSSRSTLQSLSTSTNISLVNPSPDSVRTLPPPKELVAEILLTRKSTVKTGVQLLVIPEFLQKAIAVGMHLVIIDFTIAKAKIYRKKNRSNRKVNSLKQRAIMHYNMIANLHKQNFVKKEGIVQLFLGIR